MKKTITLGLVLLLVVAAIVISAGCGGDTKQAKQYIQNGDAFMKQISSSTSEISSYISTPLSDRNDPAKFDADAQKTKTFFNDMSKKADQAIAEYEKVKTLKGVDDYVKFANLMIEDANGVKQLCALVNKSMDQLSPLIKAGDQTGVLNLLKQVQTEVTTITSETTKVEDEAKKLKSDKKL